MKSLKMHLIDNKKINIMPQIDKEIFIEYFLCIFIILLQTFSNESISENFFKINARFFLLNFFKYKKLHFQKEALLIKSLFKKI